MTIKELSHMRVGVLGLGINNHQLVLYLAQKGVRLTIREKSEQVMQEFEAAHPDLSGGIEWHIGKNTLEHLEEFQLVFRSPSIPYLAPEIQKALQKGVIIYSQTKLFFDLCPAPIIGVTGTKGKGTTASLIHRLLSEGYSQGKSYLAGNIGVDPFAFLDQLTPSDRVILELSSFQLQDLQRSPHIAVVLTISADHLDHHKTITEYREAKRQIICHQKPEDIAIINVEQSGQEELAAQAPGLVYRYTRHTPLQQSAWVDAEDGKEVLFLQMNSELHSFDISKRKLLGEHNLENMLPAAMVGFLHRIPIKEMERVLSNFEGLEHRLKLVGEYAGASFYDDSFATNPESTLVALQAFAGKPIHLIAGGNEKGASYQLLAEEIVRRCVSVSLLPGSATQSLKKYLAKAKQATKSDCLILDQARQPLFETILSGIHPHLEAGAVVLLSPAATSFASFANYKERGDLFIRAVKERYATALR